uniref:Ig-like domain-containing protein n=1 Tax=Anopheles atroparvus TaxID=41427 RepID=A0AAG5DLS5_ANOAO
MKNDCRANVLYYLLAATAPTLRHSLVQPGKWEDPYFDDTTPRNVTALVGKSAYLSCRVKNLANKTVSWIRHRDIHILTVGSYTYTSDQRFQATHHKNTDDWTLQIKWAQKRDAGIYECQISTQPVRSYFVTLSVVVPTATIIGGPDLHVDKGSTINLTCAVKYSPEPPAYIFWYHHDEVISYDSSRGGVSVITEKGDVTTSHLLIQNADLDDSGKYSCSPSNADVASVRVHVLNGKYCGIYRRCAILWLVGNQATVESCQRGRRTRSRVSSLLWPEIRFIRGSCSFLPPSFTQASTMVD